MTTIIGVQYDDRAVIIADNQVTDDSGRIYRHPQMAKISKRGNLLVAGSGEVSPCDIAQHIWIPPKITIKDKQDVYHFMITKVMPSLRKCLTDNGYDFNEDTDKSKDGPRFRFLISCCGELFDVDDTLSVIRDETGFYAVGSGDSYALGALWAGATPMEAIEIAAKLTAYTSGPYMEMVQYKYE